METPSLVPLYLIDPNPYQPRQSEDTAVVAEIADSIARNGLLQVPTARQVDGRYQLAFGHTRLAAYQFLQEECMPLVIRELDDLQMFELGVAENIKRRDLNRIEQAEAMKRYMQEFGKTSVEAGEFFNVSEEQIRATVRFLNLVPAAQEKLADGTINVETARALLSMQKIAPERTIVETIKQIEKGTDQWGERAQPDFLIERAVSRLDESVEMWEDNREGKPHSHQGYREAGWLLSMKNFPNHLLSPLTAEELAVALGVQTDQKILKRIDQAFDGWSLVDWPEILKELRTRLADLPDLVQKIDHLANPPACTACPFYTRINGTHFCGMKTCHTRKTAAWRLSQVQSTSGNLKIPAYTEKDGKYKLLDTYDKGDAALFKQRHADLRLIAREKVRGYHYQHLDGLNDNVCFVVMVGQTLKDRDSARKEALAEEKQKMGAVDRRNELIDQNRQMINWEVAGHVKVLFDALNWPAMVTLKEAAFDWSVDEDDVPEGCLPTDDTDQADYQRRLLALAMIHEATDRDDRNLAKMVAYGERLAEITKPWGVKLPKSITKLAAQMDEDIKAVTAVTEA